MILVIDNYDSFVHNLARSLVELSAVVRVVRNDELTVAEIRASQPAAIVISPGPGNPQSAGVCLEVVRELGADIPLLGVCLGHQVIGEAYGGQVVRSPEPLHGSPSSIFHEGEPLFEGLPSPFAAGRYHSLVVARETLPPSLKVIAVTLPSRPSLTPAAEDSAPNRLADHGAIIMALRHERYRVYGVQFHPESILTPLGSQLLQNFLSATCR